MTQPDHSGRRSARHRRGTRTDPARAASARRAGRQDGRLDGRLGGRRGGDRRPWPTAPTTTRVSPGKPTTGANRSRIRRHATSSTPAPTPATVWTAGAVPIALDVTWPAPLVERVVTSFSEPGADVLLLAWPTPDHARPTPVAAAMNGVGDLPRGATQDAGLADALHTVERLDRSARAMRVPMTPADETVPAAASRPFWADHVYGSGPAPATSPTTPAGAGAAAAPHALRGVADGTDVRADLIVTSAPPQRATGHAADLVALFAARLLRVGGTLVVLTHCDWTTGELTDPTGVVVTAGQNADLLYLQHIVAVHAPVRDGHFELADADDVDGDVDGDVDVRMRHRAEARGLPAPHRRIHSDVLVFAQPHDHQPPEPQPLEPQPPQPQPPEPPPTDLPTDAVARSGALR